MCAVSRPPMSTCPPSRGSSPSIVLKSVVLPTPLGPSRQNTSPQLMVAENPLSTALPA